MYADFFGDIHSSVIIDHTGVSQQVKQVKKHAVMESLVW